LLLHSTTTSTIQQSLATRSFPSLTTGYQAIELSSKHTRTATTLNTTCTSLNMAWNGFDAIPIEVRISPEANCTN
jgi:hypothetical protein